MVKLALILCFLSTLHALSTKYGLKLIPDFSTSDQIVDYGEGIKIQTQLIRPNLDVHLYYKEHLKVFLNIDNGFLHLIADVEETTVIPGLSVNWHSVTAELVTTSGIIIATSESLHFFLSYRCSYFSYYKLAEIMHPPPLLSTSIQYTNATHNVELLFQLHRNESSLQGMKRFALQHRLDTSSKFFEVFSKLIYDKSQIRLKERSQFKYEIQKLRMNANGRIKVIVGAHKILQQGWLSTDINTLNLVNSNDFKEYFKKNEVRAILAEHVIEHLTSQEAFRAALNCFQYLEEGGYIRIAVPDSWGKGNVSTTRLFRKKEIENGHKIIFNIKSLRKLLQATGFIVYPLEYHDEFGKSILNSWRAAEGNISRSSKFDVRGPVSIIIDAVKPYSNSKKTRNVHMNEQMKIDKNFYLYKSTNKIQQECGLNYARHVEYYAGQDPGNYFLYSILRIAYSSGGHPSNSVLQPKFISPLELEIFNFNEDIIVDLSFKNFPVFTRKRKHYACVWIDDFVFVKCDGIYSNSFMLKISDVKLGRHIISAKLYNDRLDPFTSITRTFFVVAKVLSVENMLQTYFMKEIAYKSVSELSRSKVSSVLNMKLLGLRRKSIKNQIWRYLIDMKLSIVDIFNMFMRIHLCLNSPTKEWLFIDLVACGNGFFHDNLGDNSFFVQIKQHSISAPLIIVQYFIIYCCFETQKFKKKIFPGRINISQVLTTESLVDDLCIFSLVLNGMSFLEYHIKVFQKLERLSLAKGKHVQWQWHIAEGVAKGRANRKHPYSDKDILNSTFQNGGLSNDGTTEYLDYLKIKFPRNIHVYRKNWKMAWIDKLEMCNYILHRIEKSKCLLLQLDVDELWTAEQLWSATIMFQNNQNKKCAYFHCHYFITPTLETVTPNGFSHNNNYEWLRMWKYETGMKFLSHAPPVLIQYNFTTNDWESLTGFNHCFSQGQTAKQNLVFSHYSYVFERQVWFKELFYGYANAYNEWMNLIQYTQLQGKSLELVELAKFLSWVPKNTFADISSSTRIHTPWNHVPIIPLPKPAQLLSIFDRKNRTRTVVLDMVVFQVETNTRKGIWRVWTEILPILFKKVSKAHGKPFHFHLVIIIRSTVEIEFLSSVLNEYKNLRFDITLHKTLLYDVDAIQSDSEMLLDICEDYSADVFLTTWYSFVPKTGTHGHTKHVLLVHDLIPEVLNWPLTDSQWIAKRRAIQNTDSFITISETTSKDLIQFYGNYATANNTFTSSNGVATAFLRENNQSQIDDFFNLIGISSNQSFIMQVGHRAGYKQGVLLHMALRAMKTEGKSPPFLVIIGPEPSDQELALLSGVSRAYLPSIEDSMLAVAYSRATALVYLSKYEGFGLPIAESMSCGCPVVAFPNPATLEVAQRYAIYVDPNNIVESIIIALVNLHNGAIDRKEIQKYGREKFKGWETLGTDMMYQLEKI